MPLGKKPHSGPERRVGPADRRKSQQKPVFPKKGGFFVGQIPHYKRADAFGKKTIVADERIGPKDRRKK